jgi:hypothetical protein
MKLDMSPHRMSDIPRISVTTPFHPKIKKKPNTLPRIPKITKFAGICRLGINPEIINHIPINKLICSAHTMFYF